MVTNSERSIFLSETITYVYSTILGICPFIYNRRTNQFEPSKVATAYCVVLNTTILVLFPPFLYAIVSNFPKTGNILFDRTTWVESCNLYLIFVATYIARLMDREKILKLINRTQSLSRRLYNKGSLPARHTIIFSILLLKTLLPVNQAMSVYSILSSGYYRDTWLILSHCVVVFTFGTLFVVVNSFSMGNLSFRLFYDAVNVKLNGIMVGLRSKRATYFQRLMAYPNVGTRYSDNCEISAAIDRVASVHSEIYELVGETQQIFQYQLLGVLIFLFVTNIVNLFQLYAMLEILVEEEYFAVTLSTGIVVIWNLMDIFLLFYAAALLNEGSVVDRRSLYGQFDSLYTNVDLDRSVSQLFYF